MPGKSHRAPCLGLVRVGALVFAGWMTSSPRAVIFDLDGTLLDSLHDIGAALNHALSTHGLPLHPLPAYRHFVGEGVQVLRGPPRPPTRAGAGAAPAAPAP